MPDYDTDSRIRRLELEQQLLAAEQFEQELIQQGKVPDTRRLPLIRMSRPLQYLGGLLLAGLISVAAVLLNFILFNMILHI